jgi:tRNA modification GTPase
MDSVRDADVIIALFDGSRVFDQEDEKILSIIENLEEKECIVAINKSDLNTEIFDRTKLFAYDPLEVSAKKAFITLTRRLEALLDAIGEGEELMLISARQIDAVEQAKRAVEEAKIPLTDGELEFFSFHLQEAVKAISSISKPYDSEEILDKMFGEFCLGK